jgi:hypothetical protein
MKHADIGCKIAPNTYTGPATLADATKMARFFSNAFF